MPRLFVVSSPKTRNSQGNKQLRRHWKTWVTESDIAQIATVGVNTIRLPVGDWMYQPYGPYVGCTDGALEEVERLFWLCRKYGLISVALIWHHTCSSCDCFILARQLCEVASRSWTRVCAPFIVRLTRIPPPTDI